MGADTKVSSLEQNPVDFYNINYQEEAKKLLLYINKKLIEDNGVFYEEINKGNKIAVYKYKNGYFKVLEVNSLGLMKGYLYSPFQLLTRFKFRNNFSAAYYYVGINYQDMTFPYIRVGTKYFKVIKKTDRFGIDREELVVWHKDEIKTDYGVDMLERVNKYDSFVIEPSNHNYKKVIGGHYNLYSPFPHKEKKFNLEKVEEHLKWSLRLMRHIFNEQIELGLKYAKILYENPKQPLPILVMVSEERSTGKSTYIDWMNIIFGNNMVIINPQDISSSFNSSYATKNIIAIEESRFESVQATEKLKALATQKNLLVNTKFVTPYTTPFYGKLIITSNDEAKFSRVDEAEIRYWVRRIGSIGEANHNILEDLKNEIPYFLHYLSSLPEIDYTKSRQVFTPEEIDTGALQIVKNESKPELQKEIEILIDDHFTNNPSVEFIEFTGGDIKEAWFSNDHRYSRAYIIKVLKNNMKLPCSEPKRYNPFYKLHESKTGRVYCIKNPDFKQINDEYEDINKEIPF